MLKSKSSCSSYSGSILLKVIILGDCGAGKIK